MNLSVDKLHPNVEEFKNFINAHPELVLKLRKSGSSLQEYYNKWVEHGDDDSVWGLDSGKSQEKDTNFGDLFNQVIKYTESMDINKVQGHVKQFNKVLNVAQMMLGEFISEKNANTDPKKQTDLFNLFR